MESTFKETSYSLGSLLAVKIAEDFRQTATIELIKLMVAKGWNWFHSSFVTSETYEYHVKTQRAWNHSLFFHMPGRMALVKASLHYNLYADDSGASFYWSFIIDAQSASTNDLFTIRAKTGGIPIKMAGMRDEIEIPQYPLFKDRTSFDMALPVFGHYGGARGGLKDAYQFSLRFEQPGAGHRPARPRLVVESIHKLLDPALPFVGYGKFTNLQITSFPEDYAFKASESDFWTNFNWGYFNKHVAETSFPKRGTP